MWVFKARTSVVGILAAPLFLGLSGEQNWGEGNTCVYVCAGTHDFHEHIYENVSMHTYTWVFIYIYLYLR